MIQILVPALWAFAVFLIGGSVLVARNARQARLAARLNMSGEGGPLGGAKGSALSRAVNTLGNVTSSGKTSNTLRQNLARAGFHGKSAGATYIGAKVLTFLIGVAIAVTLISVWPMPMQRGLLVSVVIGGLFFYIPNIFVDLRRKQRMEEIALHLPDAIDLLEISVTAGMGMDQAWNAVTDEVREVCTPLADEMALTNLEIHLGETRPMALRHMADRTGAQELSSLVACLVQAERFGTSIRDALRTFALSMRETRSHRAQEKAEKMPVKMVMPMVVLIFLPVIAIIAGPAFLTVFRIFGGNAH